MISRLRRAPPVVADAHDTTFSESLPGLRHGCLYHYEWFAGWRWERYDHGSLVAESLTSFQSRDDCIADARRFDGGMWFA